MYKKNYGRNYKPKKYNRVLKDNMYRDIFLMLVVIVVLTMMVCSASLGVSFYFDNRTGEPIVINGEKIIRAEEDCQVYWNYYADRYFALCVYQSNPLDN